MEARAGGTWSVVDVSRALSEAGFVQKKVHKRAVEADPFKQKEFEELFTASGMTAGQIVCMDEVGTVSLPIMLAIT